VFDDSAAREDWSWQHRYDIDKLVKAMIEEIRGQHM
jgi:threonine 3-dehydrogenase